MPKETKISPLPVRLLAALLCLQALSCGPEASKPAVSAFAPADIERLIHLQQSLDQLNALLETGHSNPAQADAIRQELQAFLDSTKQEGTSATPFPFTSNIERLVAVLSESGGQPSPEQSNDVKTEILVMVDWLEATGAEGVPANMMPAGNPGGSPGPAPAPGPGLGPAAAPAPGPGGPGGFAPGGPGGPPNGPDTGQMQLEAERKQRAAEEAVWRARARATHAAVVQTSAAYDQAMSMHPRPGDSPTMIEQAQAAAKAAKEAAEKAEDDLRVEARRAGVPPGWIRVR